MKILVKNQENYPDIKESWIESRSIAAKARKKGKREPMVGKELELRADFRLELQGNRRKSLIKDKKLSYKGFPVEIDLDLVYTTHWKAEEYMDFKIDGVDHVLYWRIFARKLYDRNYQSECKAYDDYQAKMKSAMTKKLVEFHPDYNYVLDELKLLGCNLDRVDLLEIGRLLTGQRANFSLGGSNLGRCYNRHVGLYFNYDEKDLPKGNVAHQHDKLPHAVLDGWKVMTEIDSSD